MDTQIRAELTEFIVTNYLFGDVSRAPRDEDALVDEGIIDSTGVLELIEFLESHFGIEVSEAETLPQNLGSISALTEFVMSKRRPPIAGRRGGSPGMTAGPRPPPCIRPLRSSTRRPPFELVLAEWQL